MQRLAPALRQDNVPLDLIALIKTILAATKEISFRVSQAHLSGLMGSTLDENIQGEVQKKLDETPSFIFELYKFPYQKIYPKN